MSHNIHENIILLLATSQPNESQLEKGGEVYSLCKRQYLKNFTSIFVRPNQGNKAMSCK